MGETTFSFRVDEDLMAAFRAAAQAQGRSMEDLLRDLMRGAVLPDPDYDAWFRARVQEGLDEAEAGLLIPNEEVEAHFVARRAASRRRLNDAE